MNYSFARKVSIPLAAPSKGAGADGEETTYGTGTVVLALIGGAIVGGIAMHYLMTPDSPIESPMQRSPQQRLADANAFVRSAKEDAAEWENEGAARRQREAIDDRPHFLRSKEAAIRAIDNHYAMTREDAEAAYKLAGRY